ncbi:MAG: hypothetical protein AAF559_06365 [Pseudomonadota bacterium]
MTHYPIHRSRPDAWTSPRPNCDPSLRALAYGPVRPMHEPSWLDKLLGRY